ncbi:hypothetical protein THRCLA_10080 [Thraustotheca clavata]|uniref:Uncharacterized protein n=1 Tax=Thraustotheca clavata TaxID=74557 RepID=A0A1V9YSS8_9STRA|nr:hypothetical protein THRCLA_10080 [Thraustotheca clavata]
MNLSNHYVIVDCQYDGSLFNDTTALKVHLLDPLQINLTTIFLQTMTLVRPAKFMTEASGLENVMIASMRKMTFKDDVLHSTQLVKYHHLLGIEFPYMINPFEPIQLLNPISSVDSTWEAIIAKSDEFVKIIGTDGVYRESPQMQENYGHYNWILSKNPVDFIQRLGLDILMLLYIEQPMPTYYVECIVAEVGNPMTLWLFHENQSTPTFLLSTQFSWFFVAVALI